MDDLMRDTLNAAAMRPEPTCFNHPGLYAPREHEGKRLCWQCWKALNITERGLVYHSRAYATGLGSEAAQESREAQRYAEEYERLKPHAKIRKYL